MKALRDPLLWLVALFIALLLVLPHSAPLFSWLFPELPRPVYQQESFLALTLAHFGWWRYQALSQRLSVSGPGLSSPGPPDESFVHWWRPLPPWDEHFRRWRYWRLRCR